MGSEAGNRIREAIELFNQNLGEDDEKMTQRRLALIVLEERDVLDGTKFSMLTHWIKGNDDIPLPYAKLIAETLKTDLNFIGDFDVSN